MDPRFPLEHPGDEYARLLDALFLEHSENTREAYRGDMTAFAAWLGAPSLEAAARTLVMAGPLRGNAMVVGFLDAQRALQRAPGTICRRLSCLKQIVRRARIFGVCSWSVEVRGPKIRSYRDTRGPGVEVVRLMLQEAAKVGGIMGARDAAVVRLLFDLGLRREEVATLRFEDLEQQPPAVRVLAKGDSDRTRLSLPRPTAEAIRAWIDWRGADPGPLFHRLDGVAPKEHLTGRAVHMIVQRLGLAAGTRCWPHGLRHSAITRVLGITSGDVRAAQRFSRHAKLDTLMIYDDNRRDPAGNLAEALALDLDQHPSRPS